MGMSEPKRMVFISGLWVTVAATQFAALLRYTTRLPGDWLGVALYVLTIVAASLAATLCFIRLKGGGEREL